MVGNFRKLYLNKEYTKKKILKITSIDSNVSHVSISSSNLNESSNDSFTKFIITMQFYGHMKVPIYRK